MRKLLATAAVLVLPVALLLHNIYSHPSFPPAPVIGALPLATPPAAMAVFQIPTGVIHRSAAFAYRGGAYRDKRDFAMNAVLVKHPRGDLLFDTGLGRDVATHLGTLPLFRFITDYQRTQSVAEQLAAAHYDRKQLRGIVLTHAHWDHVGGLPELAGIPVWVTSEERRYIKDGGRLSALVRSFPGIRYEEYGFESGAYLGFERSHDVYADGAIVIVPAPGHTPGSVLVFLTLPGGKRFVLAGDVAWQREGIFEQRERPWFGRLADVNPAAVRGLLAHLVTIAVRFPELTIVPAHDARGYAEMPKF